MATQTILSSGTASATGFIKIIPESAQATRTLQASVAGTGAVTATVVISGSVDAQQYVALVTFTLSGTNSASDRVTVSFSEPHLKATLSAISGTGAVATASVAY